MLLRIVPEHQNKGWQEALSRIQAAKQFNAPRLSLSNLSLNSIPTSISQLTQLQELDLSDNFITGIPPVICGLLNLRDLDLKGNQVVLIPESIVQLANLESLRLSSNSIAALPPEPIRLKKLRSLELQHNRITDIPDWIGELQSLQRLVMHNNPISKIPDSIGRLANLESFELGANEITIVPDSLAQLPKLKTLILFGNHITAIPEWIGQLSRLEMLALADNNISSIPDGVSDLANLKFLHLTNNEITEIPKSLARLGKLQHLFLSNNRLTAIPEYVADLIHLETLELNENDIARIPDSIDHIVNLQSLLLANNLITSIPHELCRLTHLARVDLSGNRITALPECIAELTELEILDLNNNQITTIPEGLTRLRKLAQLSLEGNPLPEELFAALRRGVPSFFRYLEITASHNVYPRTVKLVLLGEPKSGKTTLLEALKGSRKPCDESRQETLGVNVVNIRKSHPIDHDPMHLSVWDFAGQHIEHATHQFFLTENAIYLILWNSRQGTESGKRDLWYWLELLKMRVREPKFLLVATHTEFTPPDLNLSEIERNYIGCQGHFAVELSNLKGVAALEAKILELAASSPALRAKWSPEWLAARDAVRIARRKQPYMTPAAFRGLMKANRVHGSEPQRDLADQLHNLGEILYFQERDQLSSLVILDPEWVTELIALVVRSKEVRDNCGILRRTDLDKLWRKSKLKPMVRDHLIHLMDWFDLTYSTGDPTELGIVVEALPYSTPEGLQEIDLPTGQPQMEMIFRFPSLQRRLPPGIPTWGIARAHRFSSSTPWRDAAAFEDRDSNTKSHALILASESLKEVRLRVAADYPPFFFGRMEAILRDTFKRYPGAEPECRLPCPCRPDCSHSYLFEMVVKRGKDGKSDVTCDRSGEDVPISSLLTGFPRPETEEGQHAFESEMRRRFTEHLRALNEQMEKTCPSVFTLVPSQDFKQLDTWFQSATREDEMELALYCEHDSGWHPTSHSLYRFRLDRPWSVLVKEGWNRFVRITRHVAPLAKALGKASKVVWAEVGGIAVEKLPEFDRPMTSRFVQDLGQKSLPQVIDIETRYILRELIGHLDSERGSMEPKYGGLHPYIIDDARLLWLCPEHLNTYKGRV